MLTCWLYRMDIEYLCKGLGRVFIEVRGGGKEIYLRVLIWYFCYGHGKILSHGIQR